MKDILNYQQQCYHLFVSASVTHLQALCWLTTSWQYQPKHKA